MSSRNSVAVVFASLYVLFIITATLHADAPQHTISIRVDGRDELWIASGNLVVGHFSWEFPSDLVVDGVPQLLSWNGNTSMPLSVQIAGDYWVKKTSGRDCGYAVQRSDGFALAAVDNPNGSDVYEFQLFAAPQGNTTDWMHVQGVGAEPGVMNYAGTSGYVPQPVGTETTFSLNIDGTDELTFVNGNLVIRHLSWRNPTSLTINGVPHTLSFSGNLSDPISLTLPDHFQFVQLSGRTTLYAVQSPVGLVIGADDESLGADVYTWKLVAIPVDTVGDGIPNSWRQQYFGGDASTTNSQSCATCDATGTGQNNLFKYSAGLDPTNPTSVFVLKITDVIGQPTLLFNPLVAGRTYTPEFSTDLTLGGWSPLTGYDEPVTNGNQVTITDTNAIHPQKFYRIRISLP